MAITYTESWSQPFSDTLDSRQVSIEYHVVDDTNPLTAVSYQTATHATTAAAFPSKGAFWPLDTRYRLHSLSAPAFKGPRYAVVTGVYKVGPFGGREEEEDPFARPTQYRWRPVTQSEQVDIDADGNPILNSAGDPFSNPLQGFLNTYILEATRNEPAFNAPMAVQYQNTVNADAFTLAGNTIQPGEALCTGIFPQSSYTLSQEYVEVTYQFEIRERLTLNGGARVTAHVFRVLDQGRQAFIHGLKKVAIYNTNGDGAEPSLVSNDVPLDRGAPIGEPGDGGKNFTSVESEFDPANGKGWQINTQVTVPPLLAINKDPASGVTFLYYRKHKEFNFGGLSL